LTPEEYQAAIRALGLTPSRASYEGATVHQDRSGMFCSIPDASELTPEERAAFIELLIFRMNLGRH
jgi:hypothetical protein